MEALPTSDDYLAHLRTVFHVETPIALDLELVTVTDRSNALLEQFSIEFIGPASPWLRQGTYTLLHPAMRQTDLFLVPLGPREGKMVYEAVFSRLLASTRKAQGD